MGIQGARKWAIPAAAATVIGVVFLLVGNDIADAPAAPPDSELDSAFARVSSSSGLEPVSEIVRLRKQRVHSVSRRFSGGTDPEVARSALRSALERDGWKFRSTLPGGEPWLDTYCKQQLLASVEAIRISPGNAATIDVSVTWSPVSMESCG